VTYLPFFASVWSRSASATPASTPLASDAMRTLAPRIVAKPRSGTHAAGKLPHHGRDTNARLHADVLGVTRKLHHFAAQVAAHRLGDAIRCSHVVLFQLPQTDQRFLQVVVSEVLPPRRELLESAVRCASGLHERLVKPPHCIGEQFSGLDTANGRVAGSLTDHRADNVSDGIGVDPALLQNLARQPFNPLSDRLVFGHGRHGVSRRCGWLGHVMLHGWWRSRA
jgi:hypothetical protein